MQRMTAQQQPSTGRGPGDGDTVAAVTVAPVSRRRVRPRLSGWAHGTEISKAIAPLRSLARTTAQACGMNRCSLFAWCEGFLVPVMSQFASGERREHLWRAFLRLGPYRMDEVPAFARAVSERRPVVVRDGRGGEHELPPQWAATFGAASGLVLPLLRDTAVIGVALLDNGPADIGREHVRRIRGLGPYLASVIDSALSVTELGSTAAPVDVAFSSRTTTATPELQETVRRITRLYARAAEVAIYAERVRFDNMLHDTLRQTLFTIGFRIEAALRGPQRVSTLRKFIGDFKQDVAAMMMQINQVIPEGRAPAHAPWAEIADLEAQMGFPLRDALAQIPNMSATRIEENGAG